MCGARMTVCVCLKLTEPLRDKARLLTFTTNIELFLFLLTHYRKNIKLVKFLLTQYSTNIKKVKYQEGRLLRKHFWRVYYIIYGSQ